jgi:hypothetical protein
MTFNIRMILLFFAVWGRWRCQKRIKVTKLLGQKVTGQKVTKLLGQKVTGQKVTTYIFA